MFPSCQTFCHVGVTNSCFTVTHANLCNYWPNLEIVDIFEGTDALLGNFDAEVLGMNAGTLRKIASSNPDVYNFLNLS